MMIPVKMSAGSVSVRRSSEAAMVDTGFKDIPRLASLDKLLSKKWRQRLKDRWYEGIRHSVTPLGAMLVVLLLVSGLLAFATSQNVFFLLFSLLMSSILISSFVNRLMLAGLEMKFELPEHSMAGEPVAASLVIENQKRWLASFALEVVGPDARRFYLPCIEGGKSASVTVDLIWSKRGMPEPVVLVLATRFPFGFSMRKTRVAVRVNRSLYPSIRGRAGFADIYREIEGRANGLLSSTEAEFSHLREYVAGDDWRRIAWGQSARGNGWIVKQVKAGGEGRLRLWLDSASPDFELLVELAAYVVWELQFTNTKFIFAVPDFEIEVLERREAYTILRMLAEILPAESDVPNHDQSLYILSFRPGYLLPPGKASNPTGTSSH
jgi:uncharacterized protein (DUF58 family)